MEEWSEIDMVLGLCNLILKSKNQRSKVYHEKFNKRFKDVYYFMEYAVIVAAWKRYDEFRINSMGL